MMNTGFPAHSFWRKAMKGITDIPEKINSVLKQATTTKTNDSDGDLFKKTFDKILSDSKQSAQPPTSSSLSGLGEIKSMGLKLSDSSDDSMEQSTGQLLSMLGQYSQALNDPSKSLKDIEPLLKEIKTGADALSEATQASGASDALKSVAQKSSLLANVEYIKFMRGDYV
jgi:hypothetical protein